MPEIDEWTDTDLDVWENTVTDVWEDVEEEPAVRTANRHSGLLLGVYP